MLNVKLKRLPIILLGLVVPSFLSLPSLSNVYFSEYVEGTSNNKALEIYNSGDASIDLSGYKVEFYFNGNNNLGTSINLSGNIPAKGVFVLAQSNAAISIRAIANQLNGASWYNGDDAIVLKNGSTILDSIGQVGFDPGTEWGSGIISTADNSLRRKFSVINGDLVPNDNFNPGNEWDGFNTDAFDGLGSHEANGGGGGGTSACGEAYTLISSIQGTGSASSIVGNTVSAEAIVVASFQATNQIGGFFLQEPDAFNDGDSTTSDGIYVAGSNPIVSIGDRVRVTGTVAETFNLTQIIPTSVKICASNTVLPTSKVISLPLNALDDLEAVEAMLVVFPQTLTVSETFSLGRFGQVLLSNGRLQTPTNQVAPGPLAIAMQAQNNLNKILLDDGNNQQNPDPVIFPSPGLSAMNTLRGGDTVSNLKGAISYVFGAYRLLPTTTPEFIHTNIRPTSPEIIPSANLRVASFNVLNLFNGDGVGGGFPTARGADNSFEYSRQKSKVVNAILGLNADVIGLIELENDGYGPNSTIAELTNTLNSESGTSVWTYVNPGVNKLGTDEIAVGFIYRNDRASLFGQSAILDSSVDSSFIDTKNRPVLAQSFRAIQNRGVITLAINHLKSKGSACDDIGDLDTGDGQGNCARTRENAAIALVNWLATQPTGVQDKDFLIIGDLNAYAKEDAITRILAAGYTNLIQKFQGDSAYSFVFDGQAGYLDHGLASRSLTPQIMTAVDWHINADEPISLDYNTEFKSVNQIDSFYSNGPYRSSDHDPLVISLKLVIDLDSDGDVDTDDVKIVLAARNTLANEFDQRDINGDGKIDANDARTLTLQCSRPGCAKL